MLNRRDTLKLFGSIGAAGVGAPLLSACSGSDSSSAQQGSTVRVAFVVPQSGPLHLLGDEMGAGFNLYMTQHGNMLGGHPVQVNSVDEGGTVSEGLDAVNGILKAKSADVIVGVANSAVMSAIRDVVEKAQVPLLGANGSPANLLSPRYIWRVSYVNGEAGAVLGTYFNERRFDHVYVYDDGGVDGKAEADAFRSTFKGTQASVSGNVNAALNAIQNSKARLVVACATGASAASFVTAYQKRFANLPLYGPGFLTEGFVLDQEKSAAQNIYTVLNYSSDLDNDANRQFASAYFAAQRNAIPSTYAMATYDALTVLDRAISLTRGGVNAHSINAALGSVGQFDSPRGQWQFNQVRTPQQTWYLRQVRKDGRVWLNSVLQRLISPVAQA